MPKELSQWIPGGVDLEGLDALEAGLRGKVLCQSRWFLEVPVCSPGPGGGLVLLGCILVGPGLWRKRWGWGCFWNEEGWGSPCLCHC